MEGRSVPGGTVQGLQIPKTELVSCTLIGRAAERSSTALIRQSLRFSLPQEVLPQQQHVGGLRKRLQVLHEAGIRFCYGPAALYKAQGTVHGPAEPYDEEGHRQR